MVNDEELLNRLIEKIVHEVVPDLRESISNTIEREVAKTLSRALLESEFHKRLNDEMRQGLQNIYKEIIQAAKHEGDATPTGGPGDRQQADQLFQEAAQQLDKILQTTETATTEIMDIVEKHMDMQADAAGILTEMEAGTAASEDIAKVRASNDMLGQDLMRIMTTLSFQDLTGQRIKRIIGAIKKVETIVFDLYLSTGLQIKAQAEAPDRTIDELQAEAKQKVSELKGPQMGVKQGAVDDLLAQLGLD